MTLTLAHIKDRLNLQHDDHDEFLERLMAQARQAAGDFCMTTLGDDLPAPVALAIELMVCHYYEQREASDRFAYRAMRMSFEALLWPHRDLTKLV